MDATSSSLLYGIGTMPWEALGSIGAIFAVVVAILAIRQSNKHLEIEQEPYVVISDGIDVGGIDSNANSQGKRYLLLNIKNVGRGPAIRVTMSTNRRNPNQAFFQSDQPHSVDLASGQEKTKWKIDQQNFKTFLGINGTDINRMKKSIELFIHYHNQLKIEEVTCVKLDYDTSKSFFKVMENKKVENYS